MGGGILVEYPINDKSVDLFVFRLRENTKIVFANRKKATAADLNVGLRGVVHHGIESLIRRGSGVIPWSEGAGHCR